jgi:hypothetical protein
MDIDKLEPIQVGGSTQWIRIRGTNASNPVLLLMQQGPGLPIINEATPIRAAIAPGEGLHSCLLGPTGHRPVSGFVA